MKDAEKIDFKKLKAAIQALNPKLPEAKQLKIIGTKKQDLITKFCEAATDLYTTDKEAVPKEVVDFYNFIMEDDEPEAESEKTEGEGEGEAKLEGEGEAKPEKKKRGKRGEHIKKTGTVNKAKYGGVIATTKEMLANSVKYSDIMKALEEKFPKNEPHRMAITVSAVIRGHKSGGPINVAWDGQAYKLAQ